ncbi:MAG: hypothetical protein ACM33T_17355 [Solirubrobacterales bacterium]
MTIDEIPAAVERMKKGARAAEALGRTQLAELLAQCAEELAATLEAEAAAHREAA